MTGEPGCPRLQRGHDLNVEGLGMEGFCQEGAHLELALQVLDLVRVLDDSAHHDDRDVPSRSAFPYLSTDLIAVHQREAHIDEEKLIGPLKEGPQAACSIRGDLGFYSPALQELANEIGELDVIFDYQDRGHTGTDVVFLSLYR